jgi:beta-galactosidase/beta-glucuronidase
MFNTSLDVQNVNVWSVQSPDVYTVVVVVRDTSGVLDSYNYTVGIRTIEFDTKVRVYFTDF